MTPEARTGEPTRRLDAGPGVSELVAECLEHLSAGDEGIVAALCAKHPRHAAELRSRMVRLAAVGMIELDTGDRAALRPAPPDSPRRIGPFTVLGVLGEGGMGCVYLGQQSQPVRRLAAVKLIRGGIDPERMLQRFELERQALAVLQHPGIAQVLEAGATPTGQPWFAMEFVEGEPFNEWCDRRALGLRERVELLLQVCDAVTHAHRSGIAHRDLKPGNVLVTDASGAPRVKVIDFGLAKACDEHASAAHALTLDGAVLGTPVTMSPEQAGVTGQPVDLRTDVYALGAMLYESLVGCWPLSPTAGAAQGLFELQRLLRDVEPTPPSVRATEMPEEAARCRGLEPRAWSRALRGDLNWITARALAKDREQRYGSVAELAADLRRHLADEPVLAGPPSASYRLSRFARRHRREVAVGALGVLGLLVTMVVIVLQSWRLADELDSFDVLAREMEVEQLAVEARDELWPMEPATLPALHAWRASAGAILSERPRFERLLRAVAARGSEAPRDVYLHEHILGLQQHLERFADDEFADVQARIAWAEALEQRTLVDHAAAWRRALDEIADVERAPWYAGLRLPPQLGLVPLGADPDSGLQEFAFPQPGARVPERVDGALSVGPESCMVFVLVPGGVFRQGAQDEDPSAADYVPELWQLEGGGREVRLDPFLISKYELTQAQWERFTGENPSYYHPGKTGTVRDASHPVEGLSWLAAERTARRMGLALPTGAQWEYAARAGGAAPWWSGPAGADEVPELCGNLADTSYATSLGGGGGVSSIESAYTDGFGAHAPVGSFRPNPFGLHDVIGNVWEWCADMPLEYAEAQPRPGDGLQQPLPHGEVRLREGKRELRGGSFMSVYLKARSTFRLAQPQDSTNQHFGVRPVRALVLAEGARSP